MTPIEVLKILKSKIDAARLNKCNYVIETSDMYAINQALLLHDVSKPNVGVSDEDIEKEAGELKYQLEIVGFIEGAKWMRKKLTPTTSIESEQGLVENLPIQRVIKRCFCGAEWNGIECKSCGFDASEADIY